MPQSLDRGRGEPSLAGFLVRVPDRALSGGDVDEAESAFSHLVKLYEAEVDADCRDDITQTTFDAMTSFCYNIGISGFRNSTAVRYLNQMMPVDQVAEAMRWWNKPAEVMERRACECDLLVRGIYRTQGQSA